MLVRQRAHIALLSILLIVGACSSILTTTPSCTDLTPMPTGERYINLVWDVSPPTTARVGETIQLRFFGGYILVAHSRWCGATYEIFHPTLSGLRTERLYVNDELTVTMECSRHCVVDWTIPETLQPGQYHIRIGDWEMLEFNLTIEPE